MSFVSLLMQLSITNCTREMNTMKLSIMTKATGGWNYYFEVTETQAKAILNSRVGDRISLNNSNEIISISPDTIGHEREYLDGGTFEEIDKQHAYEQIRTMLSEGAWGEK